MTKLQREKLADLKWHGFSRAIWNEKKLPGFSPRGKIFASICIPSAAKAALFLRLIAARLKPCPFKITEWLAVRSFLAAGKFLVKKAFMSPGLSAFSV
jgi:hypothetical protein